MKKIENWLNKDTDRESLICFIHLRHIPCRKKAKKCEYSNDAFDIQIVNAYHKEILSEELALELIKYHHNNKFHWGDVSLTWIRP